MSTLSFPSKCCIRKIPLALKNNTSLGGGLTSSSISSSIDECRSRVCPISTTRQQQQQCYRYKTSWSASIVDSLLPESVKDSVQESVKTSILDRVTKDDSKVWASGYNNTISNLNGRHGQHIHHGNDFKKNCNNNSNIIVKVEWTNKFLHGIMIHSTTCI